MLSVVPMSITCRKPWMWVLISVVIALGCRSALAVESPLALAAIFAKTVDRRLEVPGDEVQRYASLLVQELEKSGLTAMPAQYFVLVDSSPEVQALFVFWKSTDGLPQLVGASPVSTGKPGRFDYFETPLGVFDHSTLNLDFRAEGTKNENGIRGYGLKGMRVFDFGWQQAPKGWGDRSLSTMRLQMHATDPDFLERRLGTAQSKGCIRIHATLNVLLDRYGLLDADYERASVEGRVLWMLPADRQSTPWSGRYLVVVKTHRASRALWSPLPVD
jgi:hypothetical protein